MLVLGQSLGRVGSTLALRDMENKGINHHARMFINDDGPQLDANVPRHFNMHPAMDEVYFAKRRLTNEYNDLVPAGVHITPHTFATTITPGNRVPIATVSKMAGHKNF